ncbi:WD40-repeat-containing domain protein [Zopfochytrium polystomum]|nr:WD40-repeat-containing domain protein [Zopfochytrium polystomum]
MAASTSPNSPRPTRAPINAIKSGFVGSDEVLVTVDDDGFVVIHFPSSIVTKSTPPSDADLALRPPIVLSNNGSSTWGIAIHPSSHLVAVSANSWRIRLFDLRYRGRPQGPGALGSSDAQSSLGGVETAELVGHSHNVPCINFTDDGKYLGSCSIDGTCIVWNVRTRQSVSILSIGEGIFW